MSLICNPTPKEGTATKVMKNNRVMNSVLTSDVFIIV